MQAENAATSGIQRGEDGSLAQLLHLLLQHAVKELLGENLAIVQAGLVAQPLPHLR